MIGLVGIVFDVNVIEFFENILFLIEGLWKVVLFGDIGILKDVYEVFYVQGVFVVVMICVVEGVDVVVMLVNVVGDVM